MANKLAPHELHPELGIASMEAQIQDAYLLASVRGKRILDAEVTLGPPATLRIQTGAEFLRQHCEFLVRGTPLPPEDISSHEELINEATKQLRYTGGIILQRFFIPTTTAPNVAMPTAYTVAQREFHSNLPTGPDRDRSRKLVGR